MGQTFEGRVALVTGGSTGIGAAVALELAQEGARVLITGRSAGTLRASAERHPNIAEWIADISQPADAARSIEQVKTRFGRLDVLVNNAGVASIAPLADAGHDLVQRTFAINVFGLIETTRLALPLLRRTKGAIVNLASTVADEPFANMSVYCASKAAVLALTRAWAQELAAEGIRVNAVSPGPIETPIFAPDKMGISKEELESFGAAVLQRVPSGRFGTPDEVAHVVAFLASSRASYVTGAEYTVGGGIEA